MFYLHFSKNYGNEIIHFSSLIVQSSQNKFCDKYAIFIKTESLCHIDGYRDRLFHSDHSLSLTDIIGLNNEN